MARKVAVNNLNLIPIFFAILCITTSVAVAQEKPTITTKDARTFTTLPNNTQAITNDGHSAEEIAAYPVVLFENNTYWPLSYLDNRSSFALVVTGNDAKKNYTYVNMIEARGAKCIQRIYTNSAEETVVFVGQGGREAAVSWEVLRRAAAVEDVEAAALTDSTTRSTTASATATSSAPARPSTGSSKGESITGAVAGGAFGGLVALVVLVIVVWKCWLSPARKDPGMKNSSSYYNTKGSVNLSTVSRTRARDPMTSLDDPDERAAEARRLGGIPDWQAQTAYARAMSPVERGMGSRGGYHYPFKGEDRT